MAGTGDRDPEWGRFVPLLGLGTEQPPPRPSCYVVRDGRLTDLSQPTVSFAGIVFVDPETIFGDSANSNRPLAPTGTSQTPRDPASQPGTEHLRESSGRTGHQRVASIEVTCDQTGEMQCEGSEHQSEGIATQRSKAAVGNDDAISRAEKERTEKRARAKELRAKARQGDPAGLAYVQKRKEYRTTYEKKLRLRAAQGDPSAIGIQAKKAREKRRSRAPRSTTEVSGKTPSANGQHTSSVDPRDRSGSSDEEALVTVRARQRVHSSPRDRAGRRDQAESSDEEAIAKVRSRRSYERPVGGEGVDTGTSAC